MMYAGRMLLLAVTLAASVTALPNHLKAVVIDSEPAVHGSDVSASFGGFSAKAGLGAVGSAGGLYASAESPFGNAGAGLGGSAAGPQGAAVGHSGDKGPAASQGAGASAAAPPPGHTVGHKPVYQGPGAFDNIFNIPISVLQAVNTYLNNKGPVTRPVHRRRGHRPRPAHDGDEEVVYKTVTPVKSEGPGVDTPAAIDAPAAAPASASLASSSASASSSSASGSAPADESAYAPASSGPGYQGHAGVYKRVNYDDIFNIPISALKSVNDLLNG